MNQEQQSSNLSTPPDSVTSQVQDQLAQLSDPSPTLTNRATPKPWLKALSNKCVVVPVAVALVIIVAALVSMGVGVLYIGFKPASDKVVVRSTACDDLVNEYVKALTSTDEAFNIGSTMGRLAEKVPDDKAIANDANCQFFKLYSDFMAGRTEQAMERAHNIQKLLNNGAFLDARLPVFGSINAMIDMIQMRIDFQNDPNNNSGAAAGA